jgi:hypothetical protein
VLYGLWLSLTDFDLYAIADPRRARFVGLGQLRPARVAPDFWNALRSRSLRVRGAPVSVPSRSRPRCSWMRTSRAGRPFFRAVYFAPVVTTLVAVADRVALPLPAAVRARERAAAALGLSRIDWLGDPHWALPAILVLAVWKNFGYNLLIFVAGSRTCRGAARGRQLDGPRAGSASGTSRCRSLARVSLFVCDHHLDQLLPAVRRALRDDAGRALEEHDQPRAAHVRAGLPLVAAGLRGVARVPVCSRSSSLATLVQLGSSEERTGMNRRSACCAARGADRRRGAHRAPLLWMLSASLMPSGRRTLPAAAAARPGDVRALRRSCSRT